MLAFGVGAAHEPAIHRGMQAWMGGSGPPGPHGIQSRQPEWSPQGRTALNVLGQPKGQDDS